MRTGTTSANSGFRMLLPMLCLLATISTATAEQYGDFTYEINTNDTNTVTITGYTGVGGDVVIPSTIEGKPVTIIGDSAFWSEGALTGVVIPDSVASIGDYAFGVCSSLTAVNMPASVTNIGTKVFTDCYALLSITVTAGNPAYSDLAGVLFNADQTVLVVYPGGRAAEYFVPTSVTSIAGWAFSGCSSLSSISIPNSVTSIGESAFNGCDSLTSITIPNSVTSIGGSAFQSCSSLTSVYCAGDAPTLGGEIFLYSSTTVYYLEGTTGWGATFGGRPTALYTWPEFVGVVAPSPTGDPLTLNL